MTAQTQTEKDDRSQIRQLMDYIDRSPSMFQAVEEALTRLQAKGFTALDPTSHWELEPGKGYFLSLNGSALIAFIPADRPAAPFKLIGSHTDSPALKVKAKPCFSREALLQINVEPYGGLIMRGWLDRPLGLAGRILVAREGRPKSLNINVDEDLFIIPSLAIHMDRTVNEEGGIQAQNALIPIYGITAEDPAQTDQLLADMADRLNLRPEEVIGHDLFLFPRSPARLIGADKALLSAPRIDNLAMVEASLTALIAAAQASGSSNLKTEKGGLYHRVIVANDCEEVGSGSRTGADSMMVRNILKRICLSLGGTEEDFFRSQADSFLISCDAAHAVHPAFPDLADPTNRPRLNQGPVLKAAAGRSYATDGYSMAAIHLLAQDAGVPLQSFYNHSDRRGGSTIGPLTERWLTMPTVDIGNPILAMHAVRELAGTTDHISMIRLLTQFFR